MADELFDPRKEFGRAVTEAAGLDERIVVFSADSGKSSGMAEFMNQYSDRYFECGIMEQGVVGMASGMATSGKIPVFCAIAPFVAARPYEMVRNDIGYMKQNVKLVGRNCGLTYSDLGYTHQSIDDFGLMRLIPGMTVIAPQDVSEIRDAVKAMLKHDGPVYMRIGNPGIPKLFEEGQFILGKGRILREGSEVTIISTGSSTWYVLQAAELLENSGIHACVIGMPTVSPIDRELIRSQACRTGLVVTVEEHFVTGGLGSAVQEVIEDMTCVKMKRIGVPMAFATTSKSYTELLSCYRLDADGIAEQVKEFVNSKP